MENKDFIMLIIAVVVLAVAASGNMTMLTGSSTVQATPGETITIPWAFRYDDSSFFGTTASACIVQDEYQFGGSDKVVWSGTVTAGNTYSGSYDYRVPTELGTYRIDYRCEIKGTTSGRFSLTIEVIEAAAVPSPTPTPTPVVTEATGNGTAASYTSTGDEVEAVMLSGSVWDKFCMLISLVLLYISDLLGGV